MKRRKAGAGRFRRWYGVERGVGFAVLVAGLVFCAQSPRLLDLARVSLFDTYQRITPRIVDASKPSATVVIDLDEASLAQVGSWPWTDEQMADLLDRISSGEPAAVAFDMVFPPNERDRSKFADAIKRNGRVVLGQGFLTGDEAGIYPDPPYRPNIAAAGDTEALKKYLPRFAAVLPNAPSLHENAAGHGFFYFAWEPDGIVRRLPTLFTKEGQYYPSLLVEAVRVAAGQGKVLAQANAAGMWKLSIQNGVSLETGERGAVWPHFAPLDKAGYIPAKDVLSGSFDPKRLKNRLVFVGSSAFGLMGQKMTPMGMMPGVEIHRQAAENAAAGRLLSRPNHYLGIELFSTLVAGLIIVIILPLLPLSMALPLWFLTAGAFGAASWTLFTAHAALFDPLPGVLSTTAITAAMFYLLALRSAREK
jgi:adenylate cyclase